MRAYQQDPAPNTYRSISGAGVFWRRKVFQSEQSFVFNQNVTDIIKMELWVNCMSSFKQISHQILSKQ